MDKAKWRNCGFDVGGRFPDTRAADLPLCAFSSGAALNSARVHVPHTQVILFSEDLERAVTFYTSLGFDETFRVPTKGDPIHVDLALDDYKIGIASVASTRDAQGRESKHFFVAGVGSAHLI